MMMMLLVDNTMLFDDVDDVIGLQQGQWQSMRRKSSVGSSGIFEMKPQRQKTNNPYTIQGVSFLTGAPQKI